MPALQFFDYLVFGNIQTEFIIDLHNQSHEDVLGGSALYAAGGIRCWNDRIGLVSKAASRHRNTLESILQNKQIDSEGVRFVQSMVEDRKFIGYKSPFEIVSKNPVAFYANQKLSFPRNLIGYENSEPHEASSKQPNVLPEDVPVRYHNSSAAMLCPASLMTHLQVSSILLNTATTTLLIESEPDYMQLENFELVPVLMKDLAVFVTSTSEIKNLFHNRTKDIWEMAEALCGYGCDTLVMYDGKYGFFQYCRHSKQRCHAPVYPSDVVDPTGMIDSFSGGFLAGLKRSYNPIEALVYGVVSASLTLEGTGPFYGLDSMQKLREQRIQFAREMVKFI